MKISTVLWLWWLWNYLYKGCLYIHTFVRCTLELIILWTSLTYRVARLNGPPEIKNKNFWEFVQLPKGKKYVFFYDVWRTSLDFNRVIDKESKRRNAGVQLTCWWSATLSKLQFRLYLLIILFNVFITFL